MYNRFFSLASLCAVLFSCSVANRTVQEDTEGVVPETYFKTIKRKTDKSWIIEHLGTPTTLTTVNTYVVDAHPSHEIYTYRFTRSSHKHMRFLLLFSFKNSIYDQRFFHILLCDNRVQKSWWNAFAENNVVRVVKRSRCKVKKNQIRDKEIKNNQDPGTTIEETGADKDPNAVTI